MNKIALTYLKDLQRQLIELKEDAENKLDMIGPENFQDDVSENVFERINDTLYEIETITSDVEEGYYSDEKDDQEDNFDDF